MDRASASEAGNVGSTPAGRIFLPKKLSFVVARQVAYLRADARVSDSIAPSLAPRREVFYFEKSNPFYARSTPTAGCASGGEGRSDVFV